LCAARKEVKEQEGQTPNPNNFPPFFFWSRSNTRGKTKNQKFLQKSNSHVSAAASLRAACNKCSVCVEDVCVY
jgi:hypothetical protein